MFRYNGPDAMLTLLLTAASYAITRALEEARTMWLVLAGTFIGFGFPHEDDDGPPDPAGSVSR